MDFRRTTIDERAAKDKFATLIERASAGQEVSITRGGDEVARLVPGRTKKPARRAAPKGRAAKPSVLADRQAAVRSILRLGKGLSLGGLSIKGLISEGRR